VVYGNSIKYSHSTGDAKMAKKPMKKKAKAAMPMAGAPKKGAKKKK